MAPSVDSFRQQLIALGLAPGDTLLVHSSYRSLRMGRSSPEPLLEALLAVLGPEGTLLFPALSYLQSPRHIHDQRTTPTCVGFLSEYFRQRPGSRRSLHPTHSVCSLGARTDDILADHELDDTPCGDHSPFRRLTEIPEGKILLLGCGLRPNTTFHAIEELAPPPYLFGPPRTYQLTDATGRTFEKVYRPHGFDGWIQRYDRIQRLLPPQALREGRIGPAFSHLLHAPTVREIALGALAEDPFFFVEPAAAEA